MKPEHYKILQLFSHPLRVQMMGLLGNRTWTVDEMVSELKSTRNIINAQVQNFRNVQLLHTELEGRLAHHWLDKERLTEALAAFAHSAGLVIPSKEPAKKKKAKKRGKKR
jgi:hypothetical protein